MVRLPAGANRSCTGRESFDGNVYVGQIIVEFPEKCEYDDRRSEMIRAGQFSIDMEGK